MGSIKRHEKLYKVSPVNDEINEHGTNENEILHNMTLPNEQINEYCARKFKSHHIF